MGLLVRVDKYDSRSYNALHHVLIHVQYDKNATYQILTSKHFWSSSKGNWILDQGIFHQLDIIKDNHPPTANFQREDVSVLLAHITEDRLSRFRYEIFPRKINE